MTVADILELSGVSRSAFYVHFANKAECLTAAAAELSSRPLRPGPGSADGAATEGGLRGLLAMLRSQPAAARVCFVELHAAGEAGEAVAIAPSRRSRRGSRSWNGQLAPARPGLLARP